MKLDLRTAMRGCGTPLVALAVMLGGATASAQAPAQTPVQEFSLSTSLGWSDNIRGEYVDQESETIAGLGVAARLNREHRRLNYDLAADLQYLDYLNNTFDSEVAGFASLDTRAVLVPEVFSLVLQDNFGQMQTTPFAPSTPETSQNVNVISAGPDLRWEMGDALVVLASGRYMLEQYETTPADNSRQLAQLGFYHEFSGDSSLGILAQTTRVDYDDDTAGSDFDRDEALVRYQLRARRTRILLEAGPSKFSADDGTERELTLYRVNLSRQVTSRTRVILAGGRELSDAGSLFVSSTDSMGSTEDGGSLADLGLGTTQLTGAGIVSTTDSLAHQYARATWRFDAPRTRAYIGFEARRERYIQGSSEDRDVQSITAGIDRNLNAAIRMGLDVSYNTRESDETSTLLNDLAIRLSAAWQASRRVEFLLAAEHGQRGDDSTGGGFSDNRIWARMIWSPRGVAN